jgi:hypothetical protein
MTLKTGMAATYQRLRCWLELRRRMQYRKASIEERKTADQGGAGGIRPKYRQRIEANGRSVIS